MLKTPTALLLTGALLLPAAPAVAIGVPPIPESPRSSGESGNCDGFGCVGESRVLTVTNCSKTRHGVTVRIRIRDNGRYGYVRVSHPRGTNKFYEPRVRSVKAALGRSGGTVTDPATGNQVGGGGFVNAARPVGPTFRTTQLNSNSVVHVLFRLRSERTISLSCAPR